MYGLDLVIKEMNQWRNEAKEKCTPGNYWWDEKNNKPQGEGYFCIISYDKRRKNWYIENSGIYENSKEYKSRHIKHYLIKLDGIFWDDQKFNDEIIKQYKLFKMNLKLDNINEDFI